MKKAQVRVGGVYAAKVSGVKNVPVKITAEAPSGGWYGCNMVTGRGVRIKTAARLRYEINPSCDGPKANRASTATPRE